MRVPSCEGQKGTALIDEIEIFSISGKSVLSKKQTVIILKLIYLRFFRALFIKSKIRGKMKTIKFIKE